MRISDWSSDVCSSDLHRLAHAAEAGLAGKGTGLAEPADVGHHQAGVVLRQGGVVEAPLLERPGPEVLQDDVALGGEAPHDVAAPLVAQRSEEHTSELQSLMRNSYAGFCLKKKKRHKKEHLSPQNERG